MNLNQHYLTSMRTTLRGMFPLLVAFAGCGGGEIYPDAPPKSPLFPASGKLVLADGKPLSEGTIRLIPVKTPGWTVTGTIGSDGGFALKTGDLGDGAPEGEYRVSIASNLTVPGPKGKTVLAVPSEYMDEEGSGLKLSIKPSPNDLGTIKLVPGGTGAKPSNNRQSVRD